MVSHFSFYVPAGYAQYSLELGHNVFILSYCPSYAEYISFALQEYCVDFAEICGSTTTNRLTHYILGKIGVGTAAGYERIVESMIIDFTAMSNRC